MNRNIKRFILIFFDFIIIFSSHLASYFFLYPLINIPQRTFFVHMFVVSILYILLGLITKTFDRINRFTSTQETIYHVTIIILSFLVGTLLYNIYNPEISFRYASFAFLISVVIIPTSRLVWRGWTEYVHSIETRGGTGDKKPVRTLLVGAGEAGAMYVRSLRNRPDTNIVGFLDDDKNKQGTILYGYPVIGKISDLESVVKQYDVEQVTIAIPSLSKTDMNIILDAAKKSRRANKPNALYRRRDFW